MEDARVVKGVVEAEQAVGGWLSHRRRQPWIGTTVPFMVFFFYFSCSINEGGQDNCLRSLLINCGLPLEAIAFARL